MYIVVVGLKKSQLRGNLQRFVITGRAAEKKFGVGKTGGFS